MHGIFNLSCLDYTTAVSRYLLHFVYNGVGLLSFLAFVCLFPYLVAMKKQFNALYGSCFALRGFLGGREQLVLNGNCDVIWEKVSVKWVDFSSFSRSSGSLEIVC